MILYPPKIRAEIELLADKFFASEEASRLSDDQEVWDKAIDDYLYAHGSEAVRKYLDYVQKIEIAEKELGIKV